MYNTSKGVTFQHPEFQRERQKFELQLSVYEYASVHDT